jgi:hypothetical protein
MPLMMAYGLNYQYFPKDSPNGRPLDNGSALLDHPVNAEELVLLPNVGDYVQIDNSVRGGESFSGKVRSKLFRYIVTDNKQWCQINIVVQEDDDDWGLLIKE